MSRYAPKNAEKKEKHGKKRVLSKILIIIFAAVFAVSAFMVGKYFFTAQKEQQVFDELASIVSDNTSATEPPNGKPLPEYEPLWEKNPDYFGWLKIDDTVINYPVMYTPKDSEYYLHRDFYGDYSESGMLFIDGDCRTDSNYLLIYGHHMNSGAMFGTLPSYGDYDFWKSHYVIHFNDRYQKNNYKVFAAFYAKVYDESDKTHFKYYEWKDLSAESSFNEYIENVKSMSVYDTGITPTYGDEIIALSTCNYHTKDGRFVVVAVKQKKN